MPIIFISLSETFTEHMVTNGYEAYRMNIQDYVPDINKKTYYISPSNSMCFMDGGIDLALSTVIFPNIQKQIKDIIATLNITTLMGRIYLPIGSSIIIDDYNNKSLVISPTMLLPQDVSNTNNAYYSTMAILYNILINKKEDMSNVDIIFTSLCCGYGRMDELTSINQILKGIDDYKLYQPTIINENIIVNEPNLFEQPKLYQNTEWFAISADEIVHV